MRQLHLFLRQASFLRCRFLIQIIVGKLREAYDLIEIQRQGCGEAGAVVLVGEVAVGGMAVFDVMHYVQEGKDRIITTNREINEIAMYELTK